MDRRSMTLWQGWRATTPDAAVAAGGWGLVGVWWFWIWELWRFRSILNPQSCVKNMVRRCNVADPGWTLLIGNHSLKLCCSEDLEAAQEFCQRWGQLDAPGSCEMLWHAMGMALKWLPHENKFKPQGWKSTRSKESLGIFADNDVVVMVFLSLSLSIVCYTYIYIYIYL